MTTTDPLIEGGELQRIREAAGLSRIELASKLGYGGYQHHNIKAIERGTRVIGFNVVKAWATACGYTFRMQFDPDSQVSSSPKPDPRPNGWFVSHRANRFHYDPGTGVSLCGKARSDEESRFHNVLDSPLNCRKCRHYYDGQ